MKKISLIHYRKCDRRFKLKKRYIVQLKKAKNGDWVIPIPNDIIRAYHIELGDIAIFEIVNKKKFIVRFVKKTMYGVVKKNAYRRG